MIINRSAPPGRIVPRLIYKDAAQAVDWLRGAFGFSERLRTPAEPDGTLHHVQIAAGDGGLILTENPRSGPAEYIDALMVRVKDIDAHYERAKAFGAKILRPPDTHMFGERQYSVEDLEGHHWTFTESVADVDPASWGARVAEIKHPYHLAPRPSVCYLQIPSAEPHQSAAFYEKVFGWNIRGRDSTHPSFDDAAGHVSGGFFTSLTPARDTGIIVSIWVDDIEATLSLAAAHGGEVVETAHPDSPGSTSRIATFRDPAGNQIGLYQEEIS